MPVTYTFANATAAIPLSQLDNNFATPITIGNVAIQLGNTVSSIGNVTLANATVSNSTLGNVTITSVASTFPNNYLSNSSVTIGNTAVALGSSASTIGNVTLTNATLSSLATPITTAEGGTGLSGSTPFTANGVVYASSTSALATGSALTFNGTNLSIGLGASYLTANSNYGFGTPDSAGLQIFTASGDSIRFGSRSSGTFTEQARFNSSGYLGIGTSSPSQTLDVNGTFIARGNSYFYQPTANTSLVVDFEANNGASVRSYLTQLSTGGLVWNNDVGGNGSSDYFAWQVSSSEKMRLDASGNLGLGVTLSAWARKAIQLGGSVSYYAATGVNILSSNMYFDGGANRYINSDYALQYAQTGGQHQWYNAPSGTAGASASFIQAMTLDNSGAFIVGKTTVDDTNQGFAYRTSGYISSVRNGGAPCYFNRLTSNGDIVQIAYNSSQVGSISYNGTLTLYNQTSDSRLKNDLGVVTSTDVIDKTIIRDYEWKDTGSKARGVFAQEAYEVLPNAVQVGSDELDENEKLKHPWAVDYSKYVPDLIVYCQQLKAEIKILKQKVGA